MTVFEGETTTYGEMAGRAAAPAAGLHERGVGRGDVVGLLSYNCPEFLEHSEAKALVCDEALVPLADEATLVAAGAAVIIHRAFDAVAVVDELERSRASTVWLAPAMVDAIMALPDVEQRDLSSVRVSIITKLGSVGRPCLPLELDIWGGDGTSVPAGERGEIVLRGPKVFPGYWRDPEATAKAFAGGWFHTGDIGVRDEDGYVFIVDRLEDMIVSGGENIAGSEVERVLYEHEAVLEVAVVARPDEHCRARLARYEVPKGVTFIDALPRNPSGTVLKRELRTRVDHG